MADLFQMEFTLHYHHRVEIIAKLKELGMGHVNCSACESGVDISWLRIPDGEPLEHALCLPCFLHNHTNENQVMIDRMVKVGENNGMYKEDTNDKS